MTLRAVSAEEWDAALARLRIHDVYYRRAYVEAACILEPGRPTLLEGDDGVAFAAIVRDIPDGADGADVTTPYGYGGPIGAGSAEQTRFWDDYAAWCAANGIVTTFLRFHPLYENHRGAPAFVRTDRLAGTVAWRLDETDLTTRMDGSHRNTLRKAERSGVEVSVVERPDDLAAFIGLYEETMRHRGASEFYLFPSAYWRSLTTALRDLVVRVDARLDGELVASALCLASPPWLHYHLGASAPTGRRAGATNAVLFGAATWAQEQGFEIFHLGGGVGGGGDSLLAFKRRFDRDGLRESWIGKAVHDRTAYELLAGGPHAPDDGFFPAYRKRDGYRVPSALSQVAGTPYRR